MHARQLQFPLLNLHLFDIRTFRISVNGSFFTRLGIGGVPFLLPLLYQTGLGYTPVQSGLLIVPQAIAAMGMKAILRKLLAGIGYKGVLISNTLAIGLLLMIFTTIHLHTPVVADCGHCFLLRSLHQPAIHNHEHAGLRRYRRAGRFKRELDCEHHAADVDQLWRGLRRIDDGVLCAGYGVLRFGC